MPTVHSELIAFVFAVMAALCCAGGVSAETTGSVVGTVALGDVKPVPLPPGYKARTKQPIAAPTRRAPSCISNATTACIRRSPTAPPPGAIGQQGYQFRPGVSAVRTGTQVGISEPRRRIPQRVLVLARETIRPRALPQRRTESADHVRSAWRREDLLRDPQAHAQPAGRARHAVVHADRRRRQLHAADVPPGDYRLRAFLPSEDMLDGRVTVVGGQTVRPRWPLAQ